jgi:hypothetical protein
MMEDWDKDDKSWLEMASSQKIPLLEKNSCNHGRNSGIF